MRIVSLLLGSLLSLSVATADNQSAVVDLSKDNTNAVQLSQLSLEQRIARLENIVQNQAQLLSELNDLQQSIQQLRGQVDILTNANQSLQDQQRKLYGDLDQRLRNSSDASTKPALAAPTTSVKTPPEAEPPTTKNLSEYEAYQQAYNFIVNRQFPQAVTALQGFLKQYSSGDYAANATYWLGEVYLAQGQADEASQQFNTVVKNYPTNRKVSDALLKLAFINYDKGNATEAIAQLKTIKKTYPGTTAAQLASAKLEVIHASEKAN